MVALAPKPVPFPTCGGTYDPGWPCGTGEDAPPLPNAEKSMKMAMAIALL